MAEFVPPRAICRKLAEEFGIATPHENLPVFYASSPKWRPVIEKARDELAKRIAEIGVANKFCRLRILDAEIQKATKAYLSGITQDGTRLFKQDRGALAALLRLAAEEMGELKQRHEIGGAEGADPIHVALSLPSGVYQTQFSDGSPVAPRRKKEK